MGLHQKIHQNIPRNWICNENPIQLLYGLLGCQNPMSAETKRGHSSTQKGRSVRVSFSQLMSGRFETGSPPATSAVRKRTEREVLGRLKKGHSGKGGIRICLPVHCLSVRAVTQMLHLAEHDRITRDNRWPVQCRRLRQEWPRQTKPKKGQFMNFSQGHSGTKVQCESCLFS